MAAKSRVRLASSSNKSPAIEPGSSNPLWEELLARIRADYPEAEIAWKNYAGRSGRQCVVRMNGRNIVYLKPCEDTFLVSFALSDKAVAQLADAKLPASLVQVVKSSPKYPEGRAARIQVDSKATLQTALTVLAIKSADVLKPSSRSRPKPSA